MGTFPLLHLQWAGIAFILATPCQLPASAFCETTFCCSHHLPAQVLPGAWKSKVMLSWRCFYSHKKGPQPLQKQVPAFIIYLTLALEMKQSQQLRWHSISLGVSLSQQAGIMVCTQRDRSVQLQLTGKTIRACLKQCRCDKYCTNFFAPCPWPSAVSGGRAFYLRAKCKVKKIPMHLKQIRVMNPNSIKLKKCLLRWSETKIANIYFSIHLEWIIDWNYKRPLSAWKKQNFTLPVVTSNQHKVKLLLYQTNTILWAFSAPGKTYPPLLG